LGDKDIDLELHQFGHKAWDTVRFSLRRAKLNHDVFPLNITEIPQPFSNALSESGLPDRQPLQYPIRGSFFSCCLDRNQSAKSIAQKFF
jgi:hypothetical protein